MIATKKSPTPSVNNCYCYFALVLLFLPKMAAHLLDNADLYMESITTFLHVWCESKTKHTSYKITTRIPKRLKHQPTPYSKAPVRDPMSSSVLSRIEGTRYLKMYLIWAMDAECVNTATEKQKLNIKIEKV